MPVLLISYNRPEKTRRLIEALRVSQPTKILFAVDGPKPNNGLDLALVQQTRDLVSYIDWNADVETIFPEVNLGLKNAVQASVTHAVQRFGRTIVIEDDCVPGPQLVPYLTAMLSRFEREDSIMHVSGYNVVPRSSIETTSVNRLSRYPESFAWATWERAWSHYDPALSWGTESNISQISKVTGNHISALRWKINFLDAQSDRVSSWAYRWISSIWSRGGWTIAPNRNLASYRGFDSGTHTFRTPRWKDLPIELLSFDTENGIPVFDKSAESWTSRVVFRESVWGLVDGMASTIALTARQHFRRRRTSASRQALS
mgnify:CR=1 FL=1